MPAMDGIRMTSEIKSLNPEAIIIAATAHSDIVCKSSIDTVYVHILFYNYIHQS